MSRKIVAVRPTPITRAVLRLAARIIGGTVQHKESPSDIWRESPDGSCAAIERAAAILGCGPHAAKALFEKAVKSPRNAQAYWMGPPKTCAHERRDALKAVAEGDVKGIAAARRHSYAMRTCA